MLYIGDVLEGERLLDLNGNLFTVLLVDENINRVYVRLDYAANSYSDEGIQEGDQKWLGIEDLRYFIKEQDRIARIAYRIKYKPLPINKVS